ncbi:Tll0287-like domain-containing protein [Phaeospirillum tilakii]|uniref:DUF3365 domain-containing protein n=1 Tax=Phaeospirillum tilakii TaxID=741673 RepID=A0ABW5C775_9PROT
MSRPPLPYLLPILIALPLLGLLLAPTEDPTPRLTAEADALAARYAGSLQTALKQAMEAGGPVAAIGACQQQAGPIADRLGADSGWRIKRTALRLRNPSSAPDAFETAALEEFSRRIAQGEPATALTRGEIVTAADGTASFRFVKAIAMGEPCATCHGVTLKPEVGAALAELYPRDRATGFQPGDLRGIISLSRPL